MNSQMRIDKWEIKLNIVNSIRMDWSEEWNDLEKKKKKKKKKS